MRSLCLDIVNYKYELDIKLKEKDPNASINPIEYGEAVMPFWHSEICHRQQAVKVNCFEVVGGNFNDHSGQNQSIEQCNILNNSASKSIGQPSYHKVGQFPLYMAGEGKNRVSLFRKYSVDIVADIKHRKYPDADSLLIHKALLRDLYYVSCSDKRFFESEHIKKLAFPELTIPLLEKYGVKRGCVLIRPFALSIKKKTLAKLCNGLLIK
ncbi:hypothetical protein [Neptuniibacter sp. QD57_21]|uniref:hypothetical protein n=1 Tax=Neptuniibacter sp. QD57_21 TaxID=3398213 RepID=UPI0039F569EB